MRQGARWLAATMTWVMLVLLTLTGVWGEAQAQHFASLGDDDWKEYGRNDLAIYLGITRKEGFDAGLSVGLDYEYRFTRAFGLGAVVEYTGSDFREGIAAISFDYHPGEPMKLFLALGVEHETEDDSGDFLIRLGGEWAFEMGKGWDLAPGIAFDITDDSMATVFRAAFGRKF